MFRYPVAISQNADGSQFEAKLVDLPEGPVGRGGDAAAAYQRLADAAVPLLSEMMVKDTHPLPSDAEGQPFIGISKPQKFGGSQPDLLSRDSGRGRMDNYSWSQTITIRDK